MIKLISIVGARPQFIKAAIISRVIRKDYKDRIQEIILHTGQHYDVNMSDVFFTQLGLPVPLYNLGVGSASHGIQTSRMISGTEKVLMAEKPDCVILYGDTNTTLAGAIAASKLHIPIIHVEAGLRSFNKYMPEEINRIVCDHLSTLLFCPTVTAKNNLLREGFKKDNEPPYHISNPKVIQSGDVMYDNALYFSREAEQSSVILDQYKLQTGNYFLATVHRDQNTDKPERLQAIFSALDVLSDEFHNPVIIPLHPRTSKLLKKNLGAKLFKKINSNKNIIIIQPVSFFDMIMLEKNAELILTDSGGVQKEAFFYGKPCIILRPETEWIEIVENKAGIIADADEQRILSACRYFTTSMGMTFPPVYGNGDASQIICEELSGMFSS